jgi:hypothetical protein
MGPTIVYSGTRVVVLLVCSGSREAFKTFRGNQRTQMKPH